MQSFWEKSTLQHYTHIIVGSGIVGLSTAASLLEKHPSAEVLILERGLLPQGASTKNAGFACFGSLTELQAEIAQYGEAATVERVHRRWEGLQKLRNRLGDTPIGLELSGGYELLLEEDGTFIQDLDELNDLLFPIFQQEVFFQRPEWIKRFGFSTEHVQSLIYNPLEGHLDIGKMMRTLIQYVQRKGANLWNGVEVKALQEKENQVALEIYHHATQRNYTLSAEQAMVCTNAFATALVPDLAIVPGRGQVLITEEIPDLAFRGSFHFDQGYYYFRNHQNRVLFGGGRNLDFETERTTEFGSNDLILEDLKAKLSEIILPQRSYQIAGNWSGIMGFTPDKRAIRKAISERVFVCAGLNGMGIALASTLGDELADQVLAATNDAISPLYL